VRKSYISSFLLFQTLQKKLIIQTKNEKDEILKAIQNENILSFVREELQDRKNLNYPPYKRFIKISYIGDKESTYVAKKELQETFKEYNPEIFGGFVAKLKNKFVTHMLVKIDLEKWSLNDIYKERIIDKKLLTKISNLPPQFIVNVDPEDLL
jgi:primosomal protein N'